MQLKNQAAMCGAALASAPRPPAELAAQGAKVALLDLGTALAETVAKEIGAVRAFPPTCPTRPPPSRGRRRRQGAAWHADEHLHRRRQARDRPRWSDGARRFRR